MEIQTEIPSTIAFAGPGKEEPGKAEDVKLSVPTATLLKEIYPEDALETQASRWEKVLAAFATEYGRHADFVSRSPGRVNLIGEHIDYSLYEVLPMAVTVDILLAVKIRPSDDPSGPARIRIANTDPKFPRREFEVPLEGEVEIDASSLEWSNYFKAGLRGASELLRKSGKQFTAPSLDVMASGTVPAGGGLSSSAAFVCASALAVLKASGEEEIGKQELTEAAIVSERSVGVNSGGMDQSASVFGLRGSALYVSFMPHLTATPIAFPNASEEITFLVAQSFVQADKHTTGPIHYNLRVVECSIAAVFLAKIFRLRDLKPDSSPLGISLRTFQNAFFEQRGIVADNNDLQSTEQFASQLEKLSDLVEDYLLQEEGYTLEQISEVLGVSIPDLESRFTAKFPVRATHFKLRQRALHVFREAIRVAKFKALLADPPATGLLRDLGDLMNQTQDSCRDLYECSCPELDELCRLAREAGSYGSRLTGAGWGGCTVHLVPSGRVEAIRERWVNEYYIKRFPDITEERLRDAIVVSQPGSGSFLFEVTGQEFV